MRLRARRALPAWPAGGALWVPTDIPVPNGLSLQGVIDCGRCGWKARCPRSMLLPGRWHCLMHRVNARRFQPDDMMVLHDEQPHDEYLPTKVRRPAPAQRQP